MLEWLYCQQKCNDYITNCSTLDAIVSAILQLYPRCTCIICVSSLKVKLFDLGQG